MNVPTGGVVRVMVCGSRTWGGFDPRSGAYRPSSVHAHMQTKALVALLTGVHESHVVNFETMQVIHGDCPTGADALAQRWAERQVDLRAPERFPADWNKHGRGAGPIRNRQMVETLDPNRGDYVIAAFDGQSAGTTNAVNTARKAGLHVIELSIPDLPSNRTNK